MTNVLFNSGFIGFLIWVLLFAVSTAALAIAIRCMWVLRKSIFATAEFEEKLIPFLFLCTALMVSLLPLRVLSAQPLTSCPEPAGQGETASYFGVAKRLNYVRAGLDFSRNRC